MYKSPKIFEEFQGLIALESTRHGGVSPAPYHSLNLGKNTEDLPEHIDMNRALICAAIGIEWNQVAYSKQVHGSEVLRVTQPGAYANYDAFITNLPGVGIAINVADCTPIMIYDPVHQAIGVAHAGWRGAAAQIASKCIQEMKLAYNTQPNDCFVYIGTCIEQDQFEVGMEVAEQFGSEFSRRGEKDGKCFLDLKAAICAEIINIGVPQSQIEVSPWCTWKNNTDYFSHRREAGKTGRFMALMTLKIV